MWSAARTAANETYRPPLRDNGRLLKGYRFRVCESPEDVARALAVRRRVYEEELHLSFPIPDPYDGRSWLLLAEDTTTGEAIGAIRVTPRADGPLEVEEHFELPAAYRTPSTVEVTRFTILSAYRTRPRVMVGLMKLVIECLRRLNARSVVAGATRERVWNYQWFNMTDTGKTARYAGMNDAEVTLMVCDFAEAFAGLAARHPLRDFLRETESPATGAAALPPALAVVNVAR